MFLRSSFIRVLIVFGLSILFAIPSTAGESGKIKILVFTGGHDFEHDPFFTLFQGYDDIEYTEAVQPKAVEMFADGGVMQFDVLVFYDMWENITDAQKEGFLKYLKAGKGLVALHHSIADYQKWPEFVNILGGTYITDEKGRTVAGKQFPRSNYKHDVDFKVTVADPNHPITQGIGDFDVHDETYSGFYVQPNSHVLLKANHPTSDPVIAWTKESASARVVYIQLGHDHQAYQNPNYRRLVAQAIRYVAQRPTVTALFNGKDLTGWEKVGDAAWHVTSGILVGRQSQAGGAGELLTVNEYGDFELTVEFQVLWPANSGVWFRYQNPNLAYQADILEWKDPVCYSGTLYCPGKMFLALNTDPKLLGDRDWNTFVIRCEGDHLVIYLNGSKTADVHDKTSDHGKIGFQVHPGDEFKNMSILVRKVEIRELGK